MEGKGGDWHLYVDAANIVEDFEDMVVETVVRIAASSRGNFVNGLRRGSGGDWGGARDRDVDSR